jgi:hypothetical protein
VTVAQMAIAWVLAKGRDIVPLVGASKRDRLDEALGALGIELSPSDVERIERAAPPETVAGTRYNAPNEPARQRERPKLQQDRIRKVARSWHDSCSLREKVRRGVGQSPAFLGDHPLQRLALILLI